MLNWLSRSAVATFLLALAFLMMIFAYYSLTIGHAWAAQRAPSSTALKTEPATKVQKKLPSKVKKPTAKKSASESEERIQALEAQVKALQTTTPAPEVQNTKPGEAAQKADSSSNPYDAVPADQINPLMKRMQLVRELVQSYGRAYDYRTHTVAELQGILAGLKQKRAQSAPAPAARPQQRAVPTRTRNIAPAPQPEVEVGSSSDENIIDPELDE